MRAGRGTEHRAAKGSRIDDKGDNAAETIRHSAQSALLSLGLGVGRKVMTICTAQTPEAAARVSVES